MYELDYWTAVVIEHEAAIRSVNLEDAAIDGQRPPQPREPFDRTSDGRGRARHARVGADGQKTHVAAVELERHPPTDRSSLFVTGGADERDVEFGRRVFDEVAQKSLDAAQRWSGRVARMDDQDTDGQGLSHEVVEIRSDALGAAKDDDLETGTAGRSLVDDVPRIYDGATGHVLCQRGPVQPCVLGPLCRDDNRVCTRSCAGRVFAKSDVDSLQGQDRLGGLLGQWIVT